VREREPAQTAALAGISQANACWTQSGSVAEIPLLRATGSRSKKVAYLQRVSMGRAGLEPAPRGLKVLSHELHVAAADGNALQIRPNAVAASRARSHPAETSLYAHPYAVLARLHHGRPELERAPAAKFATSLWRAQTRSRSCDLGAMRAAQRRKLRPAPPTGRACAAVPREPPLVKRAGRARPAASARRREAPRTGMRSGRRSPPSRTGGSLSARVGRAPGVPGGRWRPR
jgi:hypothetical protein